MKPRVLVIAGPTAAGKKHLALAAAERYGGEIVSADSRKVYRLLDIGTAKPSPEDRARVPHHCIDIVDPDEPFSAGEWVRRAGEAVRGILERGSLPIISGGTGFYIEAFREGLSEGIRPDPAVRRRLERELAETSPAAMHARLAVLDPARAGELHPNDTVRVLRAIEICGSTGLTSTELRERPRVTGGDFDYVSLGITMPRPLLYERIDRRAETMAERGVADELRDILDRGYPRSLVSLDTVGYKEWLPFIDGGASFDHCLEAVKRNTRRYAKRQLTWFRGRGCCRWVDMSETGGAERTLDDIGAWLAEK